MLCSAGFVFLSGQWLWFSLPLEGSASNSTECHRWPTVWVAGRRLGSWWMGLGCDQVHWPWACQPRITPSFQARGVHWQKVLMHKSCQGSLSRQEMEFSPEFHGADWGGRALREPQADQHRRGRGYFLSDSVKLVLTFTPFHTPQSIFPLWYNKALQSFRCLPPPTACDSKVADCTFFTLTFLEPGMVSI